MMLLVLLLDRSRKPVTCIRRRLWLNQVQSSSCADSSPSAQFEAQMKSILKQEYQLKLSWKYAGHVCLAAHCNTSFMQMLAMALRNICSVNMQHAASNVNLSLLLHTGPSELA